MHADNRQSTQRHVFRISVCIVPATRRLARNKTVIFKRQPRYAPEMNGISNYFVVFLAVMHLCVQSHAYYVCDHDDVETEEVSVRNLVFVVLRNLELYWTFKEVPIPISCYPRIRLTVLE